MKFVILFTMRCTKYKLVKW